MSASTTEPRRRVRVITWPLALFLAAIVALDLGALWWRSRPPGPAAAITLLGDGDLDGDERECVLRALLEGGRNAAELAFRHGALLAAIALGDKAAYEAILSSLGGAGSAMQLPAPAERELLHLGDPLLGVIFAGFVAEAGGDKAEALRRWGQADAQCRLRQPAFAADVVAAALRRLR